MTQSGQQAVPFQALPPEAPLAMPVQDLHAMPDMEGRARTPSTSPATIGLRRFLVIGSALALTAFGAWRTHKVLDANGTSILGVVMLVLFVALFLWIALAFTSSLAGFVSLITRGGLGLGITRSGPLPTLHSRTALLLPTYNEPPHRVMAGLKAIYTSLCETGQVDAFDVFILSDTTNPDVWVEEEAAFLALRAQTGGEKRIFF
ncbi:glucosyltransferase, partial [Acetobacter malorum]